MKAGIARLVPVDELRRLFSLCDFGGLFEGDFSLWLAWIDAESGRDRYAVRYEPGLSGDWALCVSFGLFQITGKNLFRLDGAARTDPALFLADPFVQGQRAREFLRRCPSGDVFENLAWWNTGRADTATEAARSYLNRIQARKEALSQ